LLKFLVGVFVGVMSRDALLKFYDRFDFQDYLERGGCIYRGIRYNCGKDDCPCIPVRKENSWKESS
jgi:hypothetical protein